MVLDDIKKTFDAVIGQLSPAKAQEMAKRYPPRRGTQRSHLADALDGRGDAGRA